MVNLSRERLALYRNRVGVITPGVHGLEVKLYSEADDYRCTNKSVNAVYPYVWRDDILGEQYQAARKHLDNLALDKQ